MIKNKITNHLVNIGLILFIILLFNRLGNFFEPIINVFAILITPFIISIFLYYVLRPVVRKLENRKINKGILVILVILIFVFLISILITYGGVVVKEQFDSSFFSNIEKNINYKSLINEKYNIIPNNIDLTNKLVDYLKKIMIKIGNNTTKIFSEIGDIGTQIILVPFLLFYFLKDDKIFVKKFMSIIPDPYKKDILNMLNKLNEVFYTYISGRILVALVIGILMIIGYLIIGMPSPLILGLIAMITSIIPFLGPFLGILPALLIGLTIDWAMLLKIIIMTIIVQQIEGNLITPNIVGSKLKLHPLAVIIIIIISVNLMGIFGAFIGVPLYFVLVILIKTILNMVKKKK